MVEGDKQKAGDQSREVSKGRIHLVSEVNKAVHFNFDFEYDRILNNEDNKDQYL